MTSDDDSNEPASTYKSPFGGRSPKEALSPLGDGKGPEAGATSSRKKKTSFVEKAKETPGSGESEPEDEGDNKRENNTPSKRAGEDVGRGEELVMSVGK
jgi:hypothetical protein